MRIDRKVSFKKKRRGAISNQLRSPASWRTEGVLVAVTVSGPSGSTGSHHLSVLGDQLLTAPKRSVSTKLLASFSANFCICGSCFLVSLRFTCKRKNWPGIFCYPLVCKNLGVVLSCHS